MISVERTTRNIYFGAQLPPPISRVKGYPRTRQWITAKNSGITSLIASVVLAATRVAKIILIPISIEGLKLWPRSISDEAESRVRVMGMNFVWKIGLGHGPPSKQRSSFPVII